MNFSRTKEKTLFIPVLMFLTVGFLAQENILSISQSLDGSSASNRDSVNFILQSSTRDTVLAKKWLGSDLFVLKKNTRNGDGESPVSFYTGEIYGLGYPSGPQSNIWLGWVEHGNFSLTARDIDGDLKKELLFKTQVGAHSAVLKIIKRQQSNLELIPVKNKCNCFFSSVPEIKIKDINGDNRAEVLEAATAPNNFWGTDGGYRVYKNAGGYFERIY